jgi:DUF4097 and DUF4098 domain-containing protein YvlB
MKWVFARPWVDAQTIRIRCGGKLTLTGHGAPEVCASVAPSDCCEGDEVVLQFDEDAVVGVPSTACTVQVEECAEDLSASGLHCFLSVVRAGQDARIAQHAGGVCVGTAQDLRLRGVQGGVEVHEACGDVSAKSVNGGLQIDHCACDCVVTGLNGGCQLTSTGGDLSVRGTNGGLQVESVDGDLVLVGHSGGVQVQSVSGDASVKGLSGGLELAEVHGDVRLVGSSGGLTLGKVDGDCEAKGNSGGLKAERVGGDLSLEGHSGSAETSEVGGDLAIRTASGSLSFDRVGGKAEAAGVTSSDVRIVAAGDVSIEGSCDGQGRWELTSETGNLRVELPASAKPILTQAQAGGEVTCQLEQGEGQQGLELVLSAAGNIEIVPAQAEEQHHRRHWGARARRHVGVVLPDVQRIVSDAIGPILGRRHRPQDLREERLMVLKMLESGKVNADEAARLLDSLGG